MRILVVFAVVLGPFNARAQEPVLDRLQVETAAVLEQLQAEVARRRYAGDDESAGRLARRIGALRETGTDTPAEPRASLHVVALREGVPSVLGRIRHGTARVQVTCTDGPVILALCAVTPIRWELEIKKGVEIRRVLTAGYAGHWVQGVDGRLVAHATSTTTHKRDDARYPLLMRRLARAAGVTVSTFQGRQRAGDTPLVVGPESRGWRIQRKHADATRLLWQATRARRTRARVPMRTIRFEGLRYHRRPEPGATWRATYGAFTPLGPLVGTHETLPAPMGQAFQSARDAQTGLYYALRGRGNVLQLNASTNARVTLVIPDHWPQPTEPRGLAIDTRRRRLLLASRDDAGYLYAFELDQGRWSVVSDMDHVDTAGLAYDARRDLLYAAAFEKGRVVVHRFNAAGERLGAAVVHGPLPADGDWPLQLRCVEGRLVILYPPTRDPQGRTDFVTHAFLVEPHSGEVLFATGQRDYESLAEFASAELERLWLELGRPDARAARAVRRLADGDDRIVAFLEERLTTGEQATAAEIERWLGELSDDDRVRREEAHANLERLDDRVRFDLLDLLQRAPSPEARGRARTLLRRLDARSMPTAEVRMRNAIRVLELLESPAAVQLLQRLARPTIGMPGHAEAKAALARLDVRR